MAHFDDLVRFVEENICPQAIEWDRSNHFPHEAIARLHSLGYWNAALPPSAGGSSLGGREVTEIARLLAYGSAGLATIQAAQTAATLPLALHATERLRALVFDDLRKRASLASFCFTEPNSGSDVFSITTHADRESDGYRITGAKCFITNASHARHFIVAAKTDLSSRAVTLFYVPGNAPGLTRGKAIQKLGHRCSDTAELHFDGVFVPSAHRIGEEGAGFAIAGQSLQRSRTLLAAGALGLCDRAFFLARKYLEMRVLYGKPLASQPAIRGVLAQLHAEKLALGELIGKAADAWDAGDFRKEYSSAAKLLAGQLAMRTTSTLLEMFGGYGYTEEFEVERLFRDAKLYEIIEGPTLVQYAILAKELFREESVVAKTPKVAA